MTTSEADTANSNSKGMEMEGKEVQRPGVVAVGEDGLGRGGHNESTAATTTQTQAPATKDSSAGKKRDGKGPGKRLHESSDEEDGSASEDDDDGDDDDDYDDHDDDGDRHSDGRDTREGSRDDDSNDEGREEGEVEVGAEEGQQPSDPPLPPGPPPGDDGWQAIWDDQHQAYYFYNALTGQSTWTNPRVPEASILPPTLSPEQSGAPQTYPSDPDHDPTDPDSAGYEPTYYQLAHGITDPSAVTAEDIASTYASTGTFNRFTGKWQAGKSAENYNDENKSRRQMEFYFDVDAAANSHDGRSLKAERQMKKLSKKELKAFREKRKEKKEQKRRAWLKD